MTRNDDDAVTQLEIDEALAEHGLVLVTGPSVVAVRAVLVAAGERYGEELAVVLDATPAELERLPARGLVGARPAVLDAVLGPVPDLPFVLVDGLPDDGCEVPDAVRAVVTAVTDRHRLAVGNALDETELARLTGHADGLDAALEAGLVHRVQRDGEPHLAPDPAVVDLAESHAGWPVSTAFARRLRDAGDPARLLIPGRVAVARGDAGVGAVLLGRLDPDEVPVETAWAVAAAAEQHGHDEVAARWHRSVAERGDAEDARASRRAAGLAELRCGRRRAAHDLLAGIDGADRATQDVLARLALVDADTHADGRIEARRRFELAADGDDELAAGAALALATMAREDGDDEAAVRWLRTAAELTADRERGTRARIVVIPVLARLGRLQEAQAAADDLDDHLVDSDPRPWREALVLARAALARSSGDLGLTRIVLDGAARDLRGAAWAAASVELDVERGLVDEVLDAGRPEWVHLRAVRSDRPGQSWALDPQRRLRAARQAALRTRDAQWAAVPTPRRAGESAVATPATPVPAPR
ncbi:hypothetical protein [Actinomycetospora soli]|uniref:hypothetical protein n=1 Tax=Actinomycetospora soli TaxID=2893887 RepID=UPI001E3CBB58|nr:hypothetical protein [Actinomycetospora soli]MCD2187785.1 hypothetical protein [Actinomycetospora soli]